MFPSTYSSSKFGGSLDGNPPVNSLFQTANTNKLSGSSGRTPDNWFSSAKKTNNPTGRGGMDPPIEFPRSLTYEYPRYSDSRLDGMYSPKIVPLNPSPAQKISVTFDPSQTIF
eukprot:NODE_523_length_7257_cov_0.781922.p5 type:complete len:113 gc:universal NODE_523_length_7257_cov_0.781922:2706-2368(-)